MGWFPLVDDEENYFCLACNTSECVYGPLFGVEDDVREVAGEFVKYLRERKIDPRSKEFNELYDLFNEFENERKDDEIIVEEPDEYDSIERD